MKPMKQTFSFFKEDRIYNKIKQPLKKSFNHQVTSSNEQ